MGTFFRSYRVRIDILSAVTIAKLYESTHLAMDGGRAAEAALQELRYQAPPLSPGATVLVTCEPLDPIEEMAPELERKS